MTWNGMTADEYYRLRDGRTALVIDEQKRSRSRVHLSIDDAEAQTFAGQIAFLFMVGITARWCRRMTFSVPRVELHPELQLLYCRASISDAALACALAGDPFGDYRLGEFDGDPTVRLHVGQRGPSGAIAVAGRGWIAAGGPSALDVEGDTENPLGAAFAACVGASLAFRIALGHVDVPRSFRLSLWNLESDALAEDGQPLLGANLGHVAIIGLGAIGSSIAYMLPLLKARTSALTLVDKDRLDYSNLNRSLLFEAADLLVETSEGEPPYKVELTQRFLRRNGIEAVAVPEWYEDAGLKLGEVDLVVPGANERRIQPALMSNYPPLMIGASTGADWDTYLQRHIPLIEDCLECRLPTADLPTAGPDCAVGTLVVSESSQSSGPVTGALPFLSMAGAILAAAEITKLCQAADYPINPNFATISFLSSDFEFLTTSKRPKPCHYCLNKQVFSSRRSGGRFAYLSVPEIDSLGSHSGS